MKMDVNVIRGAHQIGGSIVEITSGYTRVILDVGSELGERIPVVPEADGLFCGEPNCDAVLISHYHGDHIGLLEAVLANIPVYMGEKTFAVYKTQRAYSGDGVKRNIRTFKPNERFYIGDIEIVPYLCDHSAFDSYMFLLERNDEKVLYTGDFRANGRKSYNHLLSLLPQVDKLVIEGTTLSGNHAMVRTETDLEREVVGLIRDVGDAPIFVNMASTNIDRIVTLFRAAKRTGRIFLEDVYTASITSAIGGNIPNPAFSEVKVFLTCPTDRDYEILRRFPESKMGRSGIAHQKFVMMVRPSMATYLEKLSEEMDFEGGLLIYSLWNGYKEDPYTSAFLENMESLGLRIVDLHTSGHADIAALERLVETVKPHEIIPVHTENPEWFERFASFRMC